MYGGNMFMSAEMELNYIRGELARYQHVIRQLEGRESAIYLSLGHPPPISLFASISILESKLGNLEKDYGECNILNESFKSRITDNEITIRELRSALKKEQDESRRLAALLQEKNQPTIVIEQAQEKCPEKAPNEMSNDRRVTRRGGTKSQWKDWNEVIQTAFPDFTPSSPKLVEQFSLKYRLMILGQEARNNNLIPVNYHAPFIKAFAEQFKDEIAALTVDDGPISSPGNSIHQPPSFLNLDEKESRKFILWKALLRRENISHKTEHAIEKRIRNGIVSFLSENCEALNIDYKTCIPSGNSARQYLVPVQLEDKFLYWFNDHSRSDFQIYDTKRKAAELGNTTSSSPGNSIHQPPSFLNLDEKESRKFILWKALLRRENISHKTEHAIEKRIRNGIVSFLSENCEALNIDYKTCIPPGNSVRQYLVPVQLEDKFLYWFNDHSRSDFQIYDTKRKAAELGNTTSKKQKQELISEQHIPLDLTIVRENWPVIPVEQFAANPKT